MITITLTPEEAQGFEMAGNAEDDEIETVIEIVLNASGAMTPQSAKFMAGRLAKAALSARAKVKAATAYEIRVEVEKEEAAE